MVQVDDAQQTGHVFVEILDGAEHDAVFLVVEAYALGLFVCLGYEGGFALVHRVVLHSAGSFAFAQEVDVGDLDLLDLAGALQLESHGASVGVQVQVRRRRVAVLVEERSSRTMLCCSSV